MATVWPAKLIISPLNSLAPEKPFWTGPRAALAGLEARLSELEGGLADFRPLVADRPR